MMLYHATIIHILAIALVTILTLIFPNYFLDTLKLEEVLSNGPYDFIKDSPTVGFTTFGLYALWVVVGSIVSGVADLPSALINVVGSVLSKLKLAPERLIDDLVWHYAFTTDGNSNKELGVQVRVRMKNSNVYVGYLRSYPILSDSVNSKDFRLGSSVLYENGDTSSPIELDFDNTEGGGVLLNTANVSSIEYLYIAE